MGIIEQFKDILEEDNYDLDIYKRIKNDHDNHRGLLDSLSDTSGDSGQRRQLFALLKNELISHANAEEQTLYAALIAESETQEKSRHSISEHEDIDSLIDQLEEKDMSSSGWLPTFERLKDQLEHHMDEEEDEIFPLAQSVISDSEAKKLAEEFTIRKKTERQAA